MDLCPVVCEKLVYFNRLGVRLISAGSIDFIFRDSRQVD